MLSNKLQEHQEDLEKECDFSCFKTGNQANSMLILIRTCISRIQSFLFFSTQNDTEMLLLEVSWKNFLVYTLKILNKAPTNFLNIKIAF